MLRLVLDDGAAHARPAPVTTATGAAARQPADYDCVGFEWVAVGARCGLALDDGMEVTHRPAGRALSLTMRGAMCVRLARRTTPVGVTSTFASR